ncbi:hypothetical protein NA57DRAFT_59321 [Rhizodiscina lignyota]|uniref:Uncharacterized protein n=1 Tax=Rhizodiscina lignyota TaxID=1504668 RepID=A0A9P4M7Y3_9PEZI|nr:hypothetical protein NA57DRAFT_59321 [Rhizodiscina lignyota]
MPVEEKKTRCDRHGRQQPSFRLGKLLDRIAALRANMRGMLATEVVREALYLDSETVNLLDHMKTRLPYKIITSTESLVKAYTYKNFIHQHYSQNAARYWNVMRMLHLFFNEWIFCAFQHDLRGVILDQPATDDTLYDEWNQFPTKAALKAEEIIGDILASVPYSIELLEKPSPLWARFLVWPLASIGTSELCPVPAKMFIINRPKAVGERHELEHAKEAAMMLEEGVSIEDW